VEEDSEKNKFDPKLMV